jgi:predicted MFS family arabinose efflux permease
LALLSLPSTAVVLLLGVPLEAPAAVAAARVAGVALLSLGVVCWFARNDDQSPAARGLVTAMVIYNLGVAVILGAAGVRSLKAGMVLWPAAVLLHAAMAVWCLVILMNRKAERPELHSADFRLTNRS